MANAPASNSKFLDGLVKGETLLTLLRPQEAAFHGFRSQEIHRFPFRFDLPPQRDRHDHRGRLDRWVKEGKYPNRSRALQSAVNILSEREKRTRLVRELAKIDPKEEKQLAEQDLGDRAWPKY